MPKLTAHRLVLEGERRRAGPSVQGRHVDVYMWSCNEALQFGRQPIHLTVLRLGWNPRATAPSFLERFFKRPESEPLPARPLPQEVPPF